MTPSARPQPTHTDTPDPQREDSPVTLFGPSPTPAAVVDRPRPTRTDHRRRPAAYTPTGPACTVCRQPLHPVHVAEGYAACPCCDPGPVS